MRRSLCVVFSGLVLALSACGGPGSSEPSEATTPAAQPGTADPTDWVQEYCTGLGVSIEAAQVLATPQARATPQAQIDSLGGYFDAAEAGFTDARTAVEELGAPAVEQGTRHQRTVLEFFNGNLEALAAQRGALDALDPAAPDFAQRFADVESNGYDLEPLRPELDALRLDRQMMAPLQTAPACQGLGRGTGG